MIVYDETGFFFRTAIGAADICKQVETMFVLKCAANIDDRFSRNDDGYLTQCVDYFGYPACISGSELFRKLDQSCCISHRSIKKRRISPLVLLVRPAALVSGRNGV